MTARCENITGITYYYAADAAAPGGFARGLCDQTHGSWSQP